LPWLSKSGQIGKSAEASWSYSNGKVSGHAMVKFHADGGPWQVLPSFIGRIVSRRGNEFE